MDWNWLMMSENAPSNVVKAIADCVMTPEFHLCEYTVAPQSASG
jgi:hypothetical protein